MDLDIQHKGFYYIMGKNGTGKTTFLNSVLGFETFQGIIQVHTKKRGAVFSENQLYENLTVETNMQLFLGSQLSEGQKEFLEAYIDNRLYNVQVKKLSLGERKMVTLLLTLLQEPEILVLDEITTSLDRDNSMKIKSLIQLYKEKIVILACGHELSFYKDVYDWALLISDCTLSFIEYDQDLEDIYERYLSTNENTTKLSI